MLEDSPGVLVLCGRAACVGNDGVTSPIHMRFDLFVCFRRLTTPETTPLARRTTPTARSQTCRYSPSAACLQALGLSQAQFR